MSNFGTNFVTAIHIILCIFMVFVILLQPGKDAGMGAAFGGGAATSAFGGRGAVTFLTKVTAVCASLFFLTSLGLSFAGLRQSVTAGLTSGMTSSGSAPVGMADAGVVSPPALDQAPPTPPAGTPDDKPIPK